MAIQRYTDRDDILELTESCGVVRSLTRKVRLTGLTEDDDYLILTTAQVDDLLPLFPTVANGLSLEFLVVTERSFTLIDTTTVDVLLKYQHILDTHNQLIVINRVVDPDFRNLAVIYGKMKSSVQQSKTNFSYEPATYTARDFMTGSSIAFRPTRLWDTSGLSAVNDQDIVEYNGFLWRYHTNTFDDTITTAPNPWTAYGVGLNFYRWTIAELGVDYFISDPYTRRQIVVGHTYATEDTNFSDQTRYQTGEITIMQPHRTYTVQGVIDTRNPLQIEKDLLAKLNNGLWLDGEPATWMCTEVGFDVAGNTGQPMAGTTRYLFNFQWQHNPDTWDPTAVFVDNRTGRPPSDLIDGFGRRTIKYHERIDFEAYFGATFEH